MVSLEYNLEVIRETRFLLRLITIDICEVGQRTRIDDARRSITGVGT